MLISWEDFIAGWIGGSSAVIATHPLDTIRIRMQTNSTAYKSASECCYKIIKNEPLLTFYKGMLGPLIGAGLQNSIVYCVNASLLKYSQDLLIRNQLKHSSDENEFNNHNSIIKNNNNSDKWFHLKWMLISSACAGIGQTFITCPMELVKIRLQVDPNLSSFNKKNNENYDNTSKNTYKRTLKCSNLLNSNRGTFSYCNYLWKKVGIRGFYKGFISTIVRDIPGYQSYFFAYSYSNYLFSQYTSSSTNLSQLISGGIASTFSWTFIYPFDVIKSQIQAFETKSTKDIIKSVWHSKKIFSILYQGLWPTILRGFPQGAVSFFVYEKTLEFLTK